MSIHLHHSLETHNFFQKKEMNEIYLSFGIQNFALGLISIFIPIFLYDLGYSIPWILFFYFLLPLNTVLFGYRGARWVAKLGIKRSMLASIFLLFIQLAGLRYLQAWPLLFFILPTVQAFKAMFYNYSFNLNFIQHSDSGRRGKEVSSLQASALIASLLSPFLGGLVIKFFGFYVLFIIAAALLFVSIIPLALLKETYEKVNFSQGSMFKDIFSRSNRPVALSFSGFAVEEWIGYVIWPIFLTVIYLSTESIGAISSLTALVTFMVFYFVGKLSDKQDKRRLIKFGTFFYFFSWLGRIFATGFMSVLFIDTYKSITGYILRIPWTSYTYDLAARSNYFKFIVEREIIFDLSRVLVAPFIILIFIINYHPFVISFAVAAAFSLLYMSLNRADLRAGTENVKVD